MWHPLYGGSHLIGNWIEKIYSSSVGLQQKNYDRKHRDIHYKVGDLVLLSTRNLKIEGYSREVTEEICGTLPGD